MDWDSLSNSAVRSLVRSHSPPILCPRKYGQFTTHFNSSRKPYRSYQASGTIDRSIDRLIKSYRSEAGRILFPYKYSRDTAHHLVILRIGMGPRDLQQSSDLSAWRQALSS